ncbi:sulfurtransferase complex subunit TusC [Porticoccus sp. W117]|uniref:sulfurtransferase complex subunit TusC n=1 Tax=Porticoccus sp. W117 TaxID=3054777 RepID=UPI00259669F0|nr:sulfurtransferase complex subunit TusC [Porticoccus sp. W117]MDM3871697.1 sulfurtransferase complex subunit TusC [Porticoccus sp. W117]
MADNSLLFILRTAPYGSCLAREGLEAALAAASLGQSVSVLFMDDGVFQLVNDQQPAHIGQKNNSAMAAALPMYDIEQRYVDEHSLNNRKLSAENIDRGFTVLNSDAVQKLMAGHRHIVSF